MRKIFVLLLSLVVLFFVFSNSVTAHSGKTDSNGGHTDRSTGKYHYHHGYPAHQHTNGYCPYEDDEPLNSYSENETIQSGKAEKNKPSTMEIIKAVFYTILLTIILIFIFPLVFSFAKLPFEYIDKSESIKKNIFDFLHMSIYSAIFIFLYIYLISLYKNIWDIF